MTVKRATDMAVYTACAVCLLALSWLVIGPLVLGDAGEAAFRKTPVGILITMVQLFSMAMLPLLAFLIPSAVLCYAASEVAHEAKQSGVFDALISNAQDELFELSLIFTSRKRKRKFRAERWWKKCP
jgi:hypothetical protein